MCSWAVLYVGICHVGEADLHVALEQQAPWGRPPFGTLMQLCLGMAREAITYLLSNRAEKPVSRPPGSCCTLECAVPPARTASPAPSGDARIAHERRSRLDGRCRDGSATPWGRSQTCGRCTRVQAGSGRVHNTKVNTRARAGTVFTFLCVCACRVLTT